VEVKSLVFVKAGQILPATICMVGSVLFSGCDAKSSDPGQPTLRVFAAASTRDALLALEPVFERAHGTEVEFVFGASGALAEALEGESNADVFIGVGARYMEQLADSDRLLESTRQPLFGNRLCLVADRGSDFNLSSIEELCGQNFTYLCIGDPDSLTAGLYAQKWLEATPCVIDPSISMYQHLKERIIRATDVRAALDYVSSGEQIAGIVYYTDFIASRDEVRLMTEDPLPTGEPIVYHAACLRSSENTGAGEAFIGFLLEPASQSTMIAHGFQTL